MAVLKDPGQCCWVLKIKKGNHRQGEQIASRSWKSNEINSFLEVQKGMPSTNILILA